LGISRWEPEVVCQVTPLFFLVIAGRIGGTSEALQVARAK